RCHAKSGSRAGSSRRGATQRIPRLSPKQNSRMEQPLPDSELVVATPEQVSFDYQVAGLGTRAIAQLLDLLVIAGILIAVAFAAGGIAALTSYELLVDLILILGPFIVIFGYFWIS